MEKLKRNRVFKFISSVKLAVPLMITMTLTVAAGTIIESKYNTDLARLIIYHTKWFQVLLGLLFINILAATISRIPFKKHHTGFVITHIGLLTLLTGSLITSVAGIDGELRIEEKNKSAEVVLPELTLELINRQTNEVLVIPVDRGLSPLKFDQLESINGSLGGKVSVVSYLPFARAEKVFVSGENQKSSGPVAVQFRLKSPFFDVKEWLHSEQNPEFQMGPAHLALFVHGKNEKRARVPQGKISRAALVILRADTKSTVKEISLDELRKGPVSLGGIQIRLKNVYEQAMVGSKSKVEEGGKQGANPALEVIVSQNGKELREVVYAKFPDFSLQKNGLFGYVLRYKSSVSEAQLPEAGAADPSQHEMPKDSVHANLSQSADGGGGPMSAGGNTIEFHAFENDQDRIQVRLLKHGQKVLEKWASPGEVIQTPWMGIQITLAQVVRGGVETQEVKPVEVTPLTELAPSAVMIKPAGSEEAFWLTEGDSRDINLAEGSYQVYYGRKIMKLPFEVYLNKFSKVDYPGTQTPMSFESDVKINDQDPQVKISMNEPLTLMGYTLYQASYIMQPGMPVYSVFSVNMDPGRRIKYAGSLILVLGIITFTLMRSRLNKVGRGAP